MSKIFPVGGSLKPTLSRNLSGPILSFTGSSTHRPATDHDSQLTLRGFFPQSGAPRSPAATVEGKTGERSFSNLALLLPGRVTPGKLLSGLNVLNSGDGSREYRSEWSEEPKWESVCENASQEAGFR